MTALAKPPRNPARTKGEPDVVTLMQNLQKAPSTGTVQLPLMVPAQLKREFKSYAADKDFTMSALFQVMWEEYRAKHP
ncbi:hypothetical protein ACO2RV_24345 [Ancylobacter sp. VNQ12]|jgi:hypothetical protein|uniref:hypothetical protein n=1 Tax=Ancylobacter sp. VNQ12 TaxID=3400920 RepID=UPI003C0ABD63